jgi:phytoene/squalene synthetase
LPTADLAAEGIGVEALAARASCGRLRRVLDQMLDRTDTLVATARGLPPKVVSSGLRWESAVIVELATRLLRRLRRDDPLAGRVKLQKSDFLAAFVVGVVRGLHV